MDRNASADHLYCINYINIHDIYRVLVLDRDREMSWRFEITNKWYSNRTLVVSMKGSEEGEEMLSEPESISGKLSY